MNVVRAKGGSMKVSACFRTQQTLRGLWLLFLVSHSLLASRLQQRKVTLNCSSSTASACLSPLRIPARFRSTKPALPPDHRLAPEIGFDAALECVTRSGTCGTTQVMPACLKRTEDRLLRRTSLAHALISSPFPFPTSREFAPQLFTEARVQGGMVLILKCTAMSSSLVQSLRGGASPRIESLSSASRWPHIRVLRRPGEAGREGGGAGVPASPPRTRSS